MDAAAGGARWKVKVSMVTILDRTNPAETTGVARIRHPEKAHKPDTEMLRKPEWIRVKAPTSKGYARNQVDREGAQARHRL